MSVCNRNTIWWVKIVNLKKGNSQIFPLGLSKILQWLLKKGLNISLFNIYVSINSRYSVIWLINHWILFIGLQAE